MKIKKVKISSLKSHPKNPNQHPENQVNELINSIEQFEQVKNIIVWRNQIIAGNGFWLAAKKKGLKEISICDVSDWPEKKAVSFMVADNRLAELAVMDNNILTGILKEFDEPLEIPGIDTDFLDNLKIDDNIFNTFADAARDTRQSLSTNESSFGIYIQCETENQQKELLERFLKENLFCKALVS